MKLIKPLTLGVLHKPYRYRQRNYFVVAALGFFSLGGQVKRFLTENTQWPVVLPMLPPEQPLDALMPKPCGEVLLAAKAYAPHAKPAARMTVRVQVAGVDKTLCVIGERKRVYGAARGYRFTPPAPFTEMPIAYTLAHGGPQHSYNPTGRGYSGNILSVPLARNWDNLPNIEYPLSLEQQPAKKLWRHCRPAGLAPLDLRWSYIAL